MWKENKENIWQPKLHSLLGGALLIHRLNRVHRWYWKTQKTIFTWGCIISVSKMGFCSLTDWAIIWYPTVAKDRTRLPPLSASALLFLFGRSLLLCDWFLHHGRLFGCSCRKADRNLLGVIKSNICRKTFGTWYLRGNFCAFDGTAGDRWRRWIRGRRWSFHSAGNCSCLYSEWSERKHQSLTLEYRTVSPYSKISIILTEPTRTCITISPIPALVTRTDVAHPADRQYVI